mmetsp:Transcript_94933/g.245141  ORF Transcript_94933/g.245141 Transcript_94933/m.245141 type:complete len:284 (+) Transcript_94933:224-1075(+)
MTVSQKTACAPASRLGRLVRHGSTMSFASCCLIAANWEEAHRVHASSLTSEAEIRGARLGSACWLLCGLLRHLYISTRPGSASTAPWLVWRSPEASPCPHGCPRTAGAFGAHDTGLPTTDTGWWFREPNARVGGCVASGSFRFAEGRVCGGAEEDCALLLCFVTQPNHESMALTHVSGSSSSARSARAGPSSCSFASSRPVSHAKAKYTVAMKAMIVRQVTVRTLLAATPARMGPTPRPMVKACDAVDRKWPRQCGLGNSVVSVKAIVRPRFRRESVTMETSK